MSPVAGYSFLDVAVLDTVRERFAAGEALAIVSTDLEELIWANGPGAAALGHHDIEDAAGAATGFGEATRALLLEVPGYPAIGRDRDVMVSVTTGGESRALNCRASAITLPDGEAAILLALRRDPASEPHPPVRALDGFVQPGHFAAFLNAGGHVEAATPGFDLLGIPPETRAALVAETSARDRIVKRLIPGAEDVLPAGLARLRDQPVRCLLIVVDEAAAERAPVAASQPPSPPEEPALRLPPTRPAHPSTPVEDATQAQARVAAAPPAPRAMPYNEPSKTADRMATPSAPSADAHRPPIVPQAEPGPGGTDDATTAGAGPIHALPEPDRASGPVRFVWKTDAEGRFSELSPEFVAAVGADAGAVVGRRFSDVADALGLDPDGEIAGLLERRDTWSGRSVFWPIADTDLKVPVDLAALPIYARDRRFEGFRGFGVLRMADAVIDPDALGLELSGGRSRTSEPASSSENVSDPFRGEPPALASAAPITPFPSDKVIRLAEHREAAPERVLSPFERTAFQEIGERLRNDVAPDHEDAREMAKPLVPAIQPVDPVPRPAAGTASDQSSYPERVDATVQARPAAPPIADERKAEAIVQPADLPELQTGPHVAPAAKPDGIPSSMVAPEGAVLPMPPAVDGALAAPLPPASPRSTTADLKVDGYLPSAFAGPSARVQKPFQETAILGRLPVPILIHAGDVLHYANGEFLALTGYPSVDALADAGGLDVLFLENYAQDGGESDDRSLRMRTRDGEEFAVDALLRSVPWNGGRALMLAIRRTTEDDGPLLAPAPPALLTPEATPEVPALKAALAEMRTVIDTATDGVVMIDTNGLIRSISRPAEALFGLDSDELSGKPFASLFAMESQRAARDYLTGLADHGVASVLNDGREVIGREAQGRFIPLFMTIGKLPGQTGYCAVLRDITQWKRAEEELTQARAVAERSSSQKTDFLARVSHEIRTPLNAIIGFSELMVEERFGPVANDRYRDYLRDINRSGNHVLDLVNDLLDITKIEAGEQEMVYEAVSLNEALAESVAMMQPQANRERVIIRSSFASVLPDVVADRRSLRQIALNLLSNAVHYTQAGGQVIVSTAQEPSGEVVMRVRDTGVGMTMQEIEQALKPFKQINALKRSRGDGTGLGLPLTKAMVEANRALFTIASTPGEGTIVEVSFPPTRVLAG